MNCQGHEAGCVDSSGVGDGDQLLPRHRLCGMLLIKRALLPRTLKIEPFQQNLGLSVGSSYLFLASKQVNKLKNGAVQAKYALIA
mgnify:CR=1 FL=1